MVKKYLEVLKQIETLEEEKNKIREETLLKLIKESKFKKEDVIKSTNYLGKNKAIRLQEFGISFLPEKKVFVLLGKGYEMNLDGSYKRHSNTSEKIYLDSNAVLLKRDRILDNSLNLS